MGRIPPDLIDEIIYKNPVEDVISSYVNLTKKGSRYMGLCPFHSEKTPSFVVYPDTKSFYCFGCGAGGSVITFVSKLENLTYLETIEHLAERAGIQLPADGYERREDPDLPSKKRILEMNRVAARFFHSCLTDPNIGRPGMEYLVGKRKLDMATIKHFGLGYAPDGFFSLTNHMKSLGYKPEELQYAFLCGKSQKGNYYDYFRNRVMFPIIDTSGNVIGFGGRVLDDSKPKYLNTSDTPAFKKSRNLYALNFAKNAAAQSDEMILCEGYMDVIALHSAGYETAVATLGTALTDEQARIMSKYTKRVVISYDSDEAGQKATARATGILSDVGIDVRMLRLTDAKDPDEYIKKFGKIKFDGLLKSSVPDFEYRRDIVLGKYDVSIPESKIKAADELTTIISDYYSDVARELYISDIAKRLGLPAESLKADVNRKRSFKNKKLQSGLKREADRSIMMIGDKVNPEASKNPAAVKAEEVILGILMQNEDARVHVQKNPDVLKPEMFFSEFSRELYRRIMELHTSDHGFSVPLLEEGYTPDEFSRVYSILHRRTELSQNGVDVLIDAVRTLKNETDTESIADPIEAARRRMGL